MNKNKVLLTLIIFQGLLIVIGIIVIIFVIFSKFQEVEKLNNYFINPVNHNEFTLIDDDHIQIKTKKDDRVYFEIYNLENSQKVKTIIINEN